MQAGIRQRTGPGARLAITSVLAGMLLGLLPTGAAHASHSGSDPLYRVSGAAECSPELVPRDEPEVRSREAIVIVGDEGPTGFILGHDPVTGAPIPRSGAGVSGGTGTEADPYVIEGWLIEQAGNAISLRDTTAHVVIRGNRLAHNASNAVSLDNAENVAVTGNIIETNVGSGVHVEGPAPGLEVIDNALYDNARGLSALEADGLVAARNAIFGNRGIGIRIDRSTGVRLEGNVIDRLGDDGIHLTASPQAEARCNRVTHGPGIGIYLGGSGGSSIEANRVDDHGYGILLSRSDETEILANHVTWSTGQPESTSIFVYESHGAVTADNEVSVAQFGIVVRRSHDNVVEGNGITAHTWGIFCSGNAAGSTADSPQGALRNQLLANTIDDHDRSVVLRECDGTTVAGNTMTAHAWDGIHDFEGVGNIHRDNTISAAPRAAVYLWRDGGHQVVGNRITGSEDGIRVVDSSDNDIRGNALEDNRYGVIVRDGSSRTLVEGNHVLGSTDVGIYLFQGGEATVRRNGILHNRLGVVVGSGHVGGVVQDNDIRANTQAGLLVQADGHVDARANWWGCAEGPGAAGCDAVSGSADIEPWRTGPVPGVARAPVIEPLDDRTAPVGAALEVTVEAHHPDRDPFTVQAQDLPDGASFDGDARALRWTPGPEDVGDHVVTFVADDGSQQSSQSVTITVPPEPSGPVAIDDAARVARDSTVNIDVLANDEFPDVPADAPSLRLVTEPKGQHQVAIEWSDDGYPTLRFTAGKGANSSVLDYEICDVEGRCATAAVRILVE